MNPNRITLALFIGVALCLGSTAGCEDRQASLNPPGCDLSLEAQPVLIEFFGPHCPDCVVTEAVLNELAAEYDGRVRVHKINVHDDPQCANAHDVRRLPTVVLYHRGRQTARWAGPHPADRYRQAIDRALAGDCPPDGGDATSPAGGLADAFELPSDCENGACEVKPN